MDFMGNVPPELQERLDKMQMESQIISHDVRRLFREVSKDHLLALVYLMRACQGEGSQTARYFEGVGSTALEYRFDVCGGCGVNHESNVLGEPEPSPEKSSEVKENLAETVSDEQLEMFIDSKNELKAKALLSSSPPDDKEPFPDIHNPSNEEYAQMAEYSLRAAYVQTDKGYIVGGYRCILCDYIYPSIKDRMLKSVDECPGCIQKAKWG